MLFPTRLIGAAVLLSPSFVAALPRPDSAIGDEVAVSAPNGTPISAMRDIYSSMGSNVVTATEASYSPSYNSGKVVSEWASPTKTTQASSYSVPSYGSGSSSWGNQDYNSCVQQCVASIGNPSTTDTPPTSTSVSGSCSTGSSAPSATHTVIVAPTQGVLRYVPFALNASVGDTIEFHWGANNHTVTKSSSLLPCNKTSDSPFSSGTQNKDFVFTQIVNDTSTTFFYCNTPGHCAKGMFGIINPPNALASSTSASSMMSPLAANDSTFAAYANYTNSKTAGNAAAAGWGGAIDMSSLPTWALSYAAENIMYTRTFLAANKVLQDDGSIDLADSTTLNYPEDLSAAVNGTGATSTETLPSASSSSVGASDLYPSAPSPTSAAISTSSSKILLGLVVGFFTYMMF